MKANQKFKRINEIEKYFYSQGKDYLMRRSMELSEINSCVSDPSSANLDKLARIGLNMKGNATFFGFTKLSEIGRRLELCAMNGEISKLPMVVDELRAFLNAQSMGKSES